MLVYVVGVEILLASPALEERIAVLLNAVHPATVIHFLAESLHLPFPPMP